MLTKKQTEEILGDLVDFVNRVAPEGGKLEHVQVERPPYEALVHHFPALVDMEGKLHVRGIPVTTLSPREQALVYLCIYALKRWGLSVTTDTMALRTGKLSDDEMMSVGPVVVDQWADDIGQVPPESKMTEVDVKALKKELSEMGFENVEI